MCGLFPHLARPVYGCKNPGPLVDFSLVEAVRNIGNGADRDAGSGGQITGPARRNQFQFLGLVLHGGKVDSSRGNARPERHRFTPWQNEVLRPRVTEAALSNSKAIRMTRGSLFYQSNGLASF